MKTAGFDARIEVAATQRHATTELVAETAPKSGADLIVVGTHGRAEIGRDFMAAVRRT